MLRGIPSGRLLGASKERKMQQLICHCTRLRLVAVRPVVQGLSHSPAVTGPWPGKGGPGLCHVSTSAAARAVSPSGKERQDNTGSPEQPGDSDPLQDKSIGPVQRFKKTLKQYGKVMIPVHLVTSSLWFGAFYYTAMKGVNVVPFLEHLGLPDKLVDLMEKSQSGYAITAYAMYKIATPARYTVTLAGTSISVKYLRKHGYMSTPPPVKEYIQDKMEETRERFSEKMEETKERISGKMEETKDLLSGRMEETKDKLSERLQQTKDKVSFRKKDQEP